MKLIKKFKDKLISSKCIYDEKNQKTLDKVIGETILWENPSPKDNFTEQTIDIDLKEYNYIEILFYNTTSNSLLFSTGKIIKIPTNLYYWVGLEGSSVLTIRFREITKITDTGITFNTSYYKNIGSTRITSSGEQCIPYRILGYI